MRLVLGSLCNTCQLRFGKSWLPIDFAFVDLAAVGAEDSFGLQILTGFLGSGKTTLLNRILANKAGKRVAVIENEVCLSHSFPVTLAP